ncbi:MAG: asparagine synthase (glutamine-hydrolyzing), partial [Candidatus Omnitrophica bacterium]|nr:asparagine synthase (glutamine-hydrolyzing) [Candidatus Omnitrophota bacterium]
MCGICGKVFFDKDRTPAPDTLKKMMHVMNHRGPDDEGMYISKQVGLGHKRLTIIDLNTGKQPIANEDGMIWVVYNGEIYNYKELRANLIQKGHTFKTDTDTEVIVHLYEQYGEKCISKLRGMFAFALWDERERMLLLARDRVGIKPLYYSITETSIIFASEIKSILVDPSVKREVNFAGVDKFLTYFYTPGPETVFKNIDKLNPGYFLILKDGKVAVKQYWDLNFSMSETEGNFKTSAAELTDLLRKTVRDHMISDVPVGFLLSGGIDSTALLSFATEQTDKDISTFTIGFEGHDFADERPYAKLAAEKFGTKHHEMTITAKDFLDFLPKYVWHMEEPVCEPPAIALYFVSKLAKEYVKVLISGEGGDEAFAGYPNYRNFVWLERVKKLFGPLNGSVSKILSHMSSLSLFSKFEKYAPLMNIALDGYYYSRSSGPFSFFNANIEKLYSEKFRNHIDKKYSLEPVNSYLHNVRDQGNLAKMLYVDTKTWLPDDLLIKADRITMANSIELRVPLLDHKVLEFAACLPAHYKLNGFTTKYILKKCFRNRVPKEILNRKKTGFP